MSSESLVQSVISAHGGLPRYSELSSIEVKFDFTGATLALKNRPQHLVVEASISTKEQKVVFSGLGGTADEQWVFTPSKVFKQKISNGDVISSREDPRRAFDSHGLETPWDDFHFIYFCGYALWQYFNFPYLLARDDVTTRELEPHEEAGQNWRVLEVTYPDPFVFASHSKVQRYFFNQDFILQRHDYAPDVLGSNPASHYSYDPVVVGGMTFPTLRRIVGATPGENPIWTPMLHGPIPTLIHLVFLRIVLKKGENDEEKEDNVWAKTEAPTV